MLHAFIITADVGFACEGERMYKKGKTQNLLIHVIIIINLFTLNI